MNLKLKQALEWIIPIFRKHIIPFQISGGLAAHIYGSSRPINDIDLDVPENTMELLLPDIQQYITFGPAQYKDAKWDLKLIKLNYHGQDIDIGGAFEAKIFNDQTQTWELSPANLETAQTHTIYGMDVPVSDPTDLMEYKQLLSGDHQKVDIEAIRKYISK